MVSNEAAQVLIRGRWAALLAVLGGVMYFLAFPGPGLWPLGFVALVPLIVALRGRTPKHAFLLGWLAGFTTTLAGFWWLLAMLRRYSGFPTAVCVLLLALLSLYQGARMAATAWLSARATKLGWPEDVSFLVAFLGLEAIFPLLFPWYFGAVLHNVPVLIQGADLGGPILVSALLVVINAAITRIAIALLAKQRPSALNLTLALGTPLLFLPSSFS